MKLPKFTNSRPLDRDLEPRASSALTPQGCNPFTCEGRCDCAYDLCKIAGLPGCEIVRAACLATCG